MKQHDKGYSLIELIATLAVFSVLMLAVIVIMRTTLASYRDGLEETEMQEEAQIVANQIADLLIDAKGYSESGGVYSIIDPEGNTISLSKSGSTLSYSVGSETAQPLSDQISEFSITKKTGFSFQDITDDLTDEEKEQIGKENENAKDKNVDNVATVVVGIAVTDSSGNKIREYKASKDVYFRNQLDNSVYNPYDISNYGGGGDSDPNNSTPVQTILRYEPFDFSAEYDLVYNVGLSSDASTAGFQLDTTTYPNTMIKNKKNSTEPVRAIVTVPFYETSTTFDKSASGDECYIYGWPSTATDDDLANPDKMIKVKLKIDPVAFKNGSGVFQTYATIPTNNGYPTHVDVEGININNALEADNKVTLDYTFTLSDAAGDLGSVSGNVAHVTGTIPSGNVVGIPVKKNGTSYTSYNLGVFADTFSNGIEITPSNGNYYIESQNDKGPTYIKKNNHGDINLNVLFTMKLNGTEVTVNENELNYGFYIAGNTIENETSMELYTPSDESGE